MEYEWIRSMSVIKDNARKLKIGAFVLNFLVTSSVMLGNDPVRLKEFVNTGPETSMFDSTLRAKTYINAESLNSIAYQLTVSLVFEPYYGHCTPSI
ncbi:hypothetical protein BY458DRAFT_472070 [Sporodiniella umbellata]|nr:hypothetical protein BY458DRAFT_472070 [Sporodiniella umbellata]